VNALDDVKDNRESVVTAALRISDARRNTPRRVLQAVAEVDLPRHLREQLMERLKANGVI